MDYKSLNSAGLPRNKYFFLNHKSELIHVSSKCITVIDSDEMKIIRKHEFAKPIDGPFNVNQTFDKKSLCVFNCKRPFIISTDTGIIKDIKATYTACNAYSLDSVDVIGDTTIINNTFGNLEVFHKNNSIFATDRFNIFKYAYDGSRYLYGLTTHQYNVYLIKIDLDEYMNGSDEYTLAFSKKVYAGSRYEEEYSLSLNDYGVLVQFNKGIMLCDKNSLRYIYSMFGDYKVGKCIAQIEKNILKLYNISNFNLMKTFELKETMTDKSYVSFIDNFILLIYPDYIDVFDIDNGHSGTIKRKNDPEYTVAGNSVIGMDYVKKNLIMVEVEGITKYNLAKFD
jgi:hypothetical protein